MFPEIVLEIGINHNGDINIAKKLIDIAAAAGIHYVKFQKRTIDLVYTEEELNKYRESPWGTTTRQQKEGLEFGQKEYEEIDRYSKTIGVEWFASPWDINSLHFLMNFQVPFIKIPSALITDLPFIESCRKTSIPLIVSTGMSDLGMVDTAIDVIGIDQIYSILHCTSTYPSKPEELNIKYITILNKLYPWTKIGFSNHYPGLMGMIMAYCLGAEMIEFHATLDRSMYGSDQAASISPRGIFELMERLRLIDQMKGNGIKRIFESEISMIKKLRKDLTDKINV